MRRRDERGSSLLLVLVTITIISIGLGALLSRSDASIRATAALREQAVATYEAEAAMQAAINNLRNSSFRNAPGQLCFGLSDSLSFPAFNGLRSAAVSCSADSLGAVFQCGSPCNKPLNAILTRGTTADDGLHVVQPPGSVLSVDGPVFSNAGIDVPAGELRAVGGLWARSSCAGTILSAVCDYGSVLNPRGDDPGYSPSLSSAPAKAVLPGCTTPGSVVTFQPGYYDDAVALSSMMSSASPCHSSTWWFKPGAYYFDFHNSGPNANPLLPAVANEWTVGSGRVVAGTRSGTTCIDPTIDTSAPGAQFIFGGSSRLKIEGAALDLCGTYSTTEPPIALYGLGSGSESDTSVLLKPTGVALLGDFGLSATPSRLANVDGVAATWRSATVGDTAVLTVNGFGQAGAIPPGSVLQSAAVRLTHRHSAPESEQLDISVATSTGPNLSASVMGGPGGTAFRTDVIPLDPDRIGTLAKAIHDGTFGGATIAVTTTLAAAGDTEDIDAIQLELTYTKPAFRAVSGCLTMGPYTAAAGSPGCALVAGDQVRIKGTAYAPDAVLDVGNGSAFRAGVIARSLWLRRSGTGAGPVISVPGDSPGFTFAVYLSVYRCPNALLCLPSGQPVLRAKVALIDADPARPDPGARRVSVLSWWRPG
ncbi:type II secretion system GspH family protein [Kribbella sp. NBC_01245]|uniref:type IV pilus modification PilV family protein n=1 Tax=Kribbella sp. NBC_01245 TaxID=2903578 RepID=UPI002E2939D3|nr:type II secretion system protein [Kribbella sp. NBC_01245]